MHPHYFMNILFTIIKQKYRCFLYFKINSTYYNDKCLFYAECFINLYCYSFQKLQTQLKFIIMRKFISTIPDSKVTDDFTNAVKAALSPFDPFKINLTNEEKIGMRSMAEGREGYARLISRIATQFPDSLSRADTPEELTVLLDYYQSLEANRMALVQSLETIQEIQLGASSDIMTRVDRYAQNLQISRANEGSLDIAMEDVDNWNSKFANKPSTTPPVNP